MEIPLEGVVTGLGIMTAGASILAYYIHKASRVFKKATQADQERRQKLEQEETSLREKLLLRYQQMYEQEKERGEREITVLREEIKQLRDEMALLRRENQELRALNLRYQQEQK